MESTDIGPPSARDERVAELIATTALAKSLNIVKLQDALRRRHVDCLGYSKFDADHVAAQLVKFGDHRSENFYPQLIALLEAAQQIPTPPRLASKARSNDE